MSKTDAIRAIRSKVLKYGYEIFLLACMFYLASDIYSNGILFLDSVKYAGLPFFSSLLTMFLAIGKTTVVEIIIIYVVTLLQLISRQRAPKL